MSQGTPQPAGVDPPVSPETPQTQPLASTQEAVNPEATAHSSRPLRSGPKASIMTCRDTANVLMLECRHAHADTDWNRVRQLAQIIVDEASKEIEL